MQTETATKKLFTVDEYYRMAETGILTECQRTELINGEIIEVSPMGSWHGAALSLADSFLKPILKEKALVRVQMPVRLDEFNEPEPDISIVKPRQDHYMRRHPVPSDVLGVLEISYSTLEYDRDIKSPVYAAAGIAEVWIANLKEQTLLVLRDPSKEGYRTSLIFRRADTVSFLALPEVAFPVAALLGPDPSMNAARF